jgi:hypothetical protein
MITDIVRVGTDEVFTTVLRFEKAVQIMECLNNAMENTGRQSRFTVATPWKVGGVINVPIELEHRQCHDERTNLY